ncbi:MAG: MATE family efflux transporter [Proteobacteria bacterium]|nr:MATE family efflux transporter [Pseudomonadota bacterium]MDA1062931.1 MATE family efflux transporter [Pseudomonadota bacterium]
MRYRAAMFSSGNWRHELRALLGLAGPLIVNNLSMAGIHFADAVMAGRLGAESLAAVAVGGSVWFFGFAFCLGTMMAISPIAARHYGAGNPEIIGRYTRQGILLGIIMAIALIAIFYLFAGSALDLVGIDPQFRELTEGYVLAIVLGAPGIFIFLALRFTTEGIGETRPIMYVSVASLFVNVFLNWVLMYGKLGAPALGAVGCGLASAITMWMMMISLAIYMWRSKIYASMQIFSRAGRLRAAALKEILVLGLPIAITITAEAGLFNAASVLMGTRSASIAAAHQVAINFASLMFMIPLALSAAITVRVGHALGSGNAQAARFSGGFGIAACAIFMTCSAVFMLLFRDMVVSMYTDDPSVTSIAINLLLAAAIFQVADGVQIGAAGALRGYKDTHFPMAINTFAYWVLAFPLAYMAAVTYKAAPVYTWVAFIVGLSVAATLLTWRFARLSHASLDIDPAPPG